MNIFVPSRDIIIPRRRFIRDASMLGLASLIPNKSNAALSFNGTTQYLISGSALTPLTNFSVYIRFKLTTTATNQVLFVAGDTTTNDMNYILTIGSTGLWVGTYNGAGSAAQIGGLSLTTGVWYSILGTWNANNERIAWDGTTRVTDTTSLSITSTNRTVFGAQYLAGTPSGYFSGSMSDMAVWGTGLMTPTQIDLGEVNSMFNGVSPVHVRPQALTDYWPQWLPSGNVTGIRGNVLTAVNSNTLDPNNHRLYP